MSNILNVLKFFLVMIVVAMEKIMGGFDWMLKCLIILMVLDFIAGILKAIHNKELSSEICYFGIVKKIFILVIICLAVMIDKQLKSLGIDAPIIRDITIAYYSINEMISIIENVSNYIPVPDKIKEILEQLKNENHKKQKK